MLVLDQHSVSAAMQVWGLELRRKKWHWNVSTSPWQQRSQLFTDVIEQISAHSEVLQPVIFSKRPQNNMHPLLTAPLATVRLHRDRFTVVVFTETTNEIAAYSVRRLFCLFLTEKHHKWPLLQRRKTKNWLYSNNISADRTPAMLTAYSWFAATHNQSRAAFAERQTFDLSVDNKNALKTKSQDHIVYYPDNLSGYRSHLNTGWKQRN